MENHADGYLQRNAAAQTEKLLEKMKKNPRISSANIKLIEKFLTVLQANGMKPRTLLRHAYCYSKLMEVYPKKPLLNAKKDDIAKAVSKIEAMQNIGAPVKAKVKATLKQIFKTYKGDGYYCPKAVAWVKIGKQRSSRLTAEDLLNDRERGELIKHGRTPRNQAIISLMLEAPMRPHEVLLLRRKHLNLENYPPYLLIPEESKTGMRRIPLLDSVVYLTRYLETVDLKPDDPLFLSGEDPEYKTKRPMTYDALRETLAKATKRAKITKRVYLYLTRHTVITRNAPFLTRSIQEKISGWKPGSAMPGVYEHLSNTDVDNAVLKAHGLDPLKDEDNKVQTALCPRCKFINPTTMVYCGRCGSPMNMNVALNVQEAEAKLKEAIASDITKGPKALEAKLEALAKEIEALKKEAKVKK